MTAQELQKQFQAKGIDLPIEKVQELCDRMVADYRAAHADCQLSNDEICRNLHADLVIEEVDPARILGLNILTTVLTRVVRDARRQYGDHWRERLVEHAVANGFPRERAERALNMLKKCPEPEPTIEINDGLMSRKVGIA